MKFLLVSLVSLLVSISSLAQIQPRVVYEEFANGMKITTLQLPYPGRALHDLWGSSAGDYLEVKVYEPESGEISQDWIELTGHSGHAGDAAEFIERMVGEGNRVAAVSYPEHGSSSGVNLDFMFLSDYGKVVSSLDSYMRRTPGTRSLNMIGFSTGGL